MNKTFREVQTRPFRLAKRCLRQGHLGLYLLMALCLAGNGSLAHAQNSGSIFGTVVDATGALIPAAKATLTEPDHGFSSTVTTNSAGAYLFTAVPVGTYTLTIEAPKFKTSVDQGIIVDANQNVKMDVKLFLGSASTDVTVTTEGSVVDTRSATLGTMIDNKLVEDLPINGENVVALAALLPGVTGVNAPTTVTNERNGPTYTVSGSRTNSLIFFRILLFPLSR